MFASSSIIKTRLPMCVLIANAHSATTEIPFFSPGNGSGYDKLEAVPVFAVRDLRHIRRQATVYYGCFPRFGGDGDGNVALVFPLPVSKATGDGYPFPLKAAISITTSFWFLPIAVAFLPEFNFFSASKGDDLGEATGDGLSFERDVGRTAPAPDLPDIWAKASKTWVRSPSVKSSSWTPFAASTARRFSSVFVS